MTPSDKHIDAAEKPKKRLPIAPKADLRALEEPLSVLPAPARPDEIPAFDRGALRAEGRPLRASSYVIYIDLPDNPEDMLLIHGYTGAHDRVSRRVATYVRALAARPASKPLYGAWSPEPARESPAPPPSDQAIEALKKRGYLTTLTVEEEEARFTDLAARIHYGRLRAAPSYILMPTYQCNLRCPYCFQDAMRTDPKNHHLLRVMDLAMVDRIFRGMRHIDAAHGVEAGTDLDRTIILFGGEPLLEASRSTVAYIVQKASEMRGARFMAITTATELHAYRGLLGPTKIEALQVTLDGPPGEHDRRRIYADGSGSFARIAENVSMALALGVKVSVRINVDRHNVERLPELAEEFVGRGWEGHPRFSSYAAPVTAYNEKTDPASTFDSWKLRLAMESLSARHALVASIGTYDDALLEGAARIFERRNDPLPSFKASFCGAHEGMYVFDAFGDIYACWDRTGDPNLRVGAVREDGEVWMNRAMMESWRRRNVASNPVCRSCAYALHCGGGCAVMAEDQRGTMYTNYCDGFGKRFRAAVAEAYRAHVSGVTRENKTSRVCGM